MISIAYNGTRDQAEQICKMFKRTWILDYADKFALCIYFRGEDHIVKTGDIIEEEDGKIKIIPNLGLCL